ncbi:class I SAM-dependent methyltransferase [Streptomyces sp. AV19]|uniref:class I SAM-dependent methyltransferase n=1 Tax=Streptomyces sp. AV19 TaxID=2793068 RepID=UPI0018FE5086|nr:class I SAM-dependent methyltransferase [Streptomyces sp. AV19]MBH1937312.1 class I SAM-dependent methyltransferase [Streptomyces sp. AV19]MDG4536790.1 class I SAM-dependent methyltransferase [Streptomyces sp. AV19]
MEREKITLTGAPETMLATLYGRALDSRSPRSLLHDDEALKAVQRIDYDFRRARMSSMSAAQVVLRAKQLDDWTEQFITRNPGATVLHLACGLDTRVHRLAPPPTVRWIDVDFPEVIELRNRLLPDPGGDYRTIGTSVTEEGWVEQLPVDRPTVAVFEGLAMYLREEDGRRLIRRITEHFPGGEMLFDVFGAFGIRMQLLIPVVRNAHAKLYWGVDDPQEIESLHEGVKCLEALRIHELKAIDRLSASNRCWARVVGRTPRMRNAWRMLRFRF